MKTIPYRTALIIGAGSGISASLARLLSAAGLNVALAARNTAKLAPLTRDGCCRFDGGCRGSRLRRQLFAAVDARLASRTW